MINKILFYHGTTNDDCCSRRFTIAALFPNEGYDDLELGISICGLNDQFVRRVGRDKAEGRLSSSRKGRLVTSLYSETYFKSKNKGGFKENYFVGKEIKILLKLCKKFEKMTFDELKCEFNLNQH